MSGAFMTSSGQLVKSCIDASGAVLADSSTDGSDKGVPLRRSRIHKQLFGDRTLGDKVSYSVANDAEVSCPDEQILDIGPFAEDLFR